ncbi:MAG: hypothetical protein EBZ48_16975 [Proteobacteria bacterium]|nr:hypothetical protein [Pseudomonadota bacterium]
MSRDNSGTPYEELALNRRNNNCWVFLRHAERIAIDVLVHDQVANHADLAVREGLYQCRQPALGGAPALEEI